MRNKFDKQVRHWAQSPFPKKHAQKIFQHARPPAQTHTLTFLKHCAQKAVRLELRIELDKQVVRRELALTYLEHTIQIAALCYLTYPKIKSRPAVPRENGPNSARLFGRTLALSGRGCGHLLRARASLPCAFALSASHTLTCVAKSVQKRLSTMCSRAFS